MKLARPSRCVGAAVLTLSGCSASGGGSGSRSLRAWKVGIGFWAALVGVALLAVGYVILVVAYVIRRRNDTTTGSGKGPIRKSSEALTPMVVLHRTGFLLAVLGVFLWGMGI